MANIVLKKKVALTAACNLVQVGVEVAADDEDWNFIQAVQNSKKQASRFAKYIGCSKFFVCSPSPGPHQFWS